jgi:hypothetical protein
LRGMGDPIPTKGQGNMVCALLVCRKQKISDLEVPLFLQNKAFANTKKLVFDEESTLKGAASQARVLKLFGLKLETRFQKK